MTKEEITALCDSAELLGIGLGETIDQKALRRAYTKFAHEWHPDVAGKRGVPLEESNAMMAKGNSAHATLKKAIDGGEGEYTIPERPDPDPEPTYDPFATGRHTQWAPTGSRRTTTTGGTWGTGQTSTTGEGAWGRYGSNDDADDDDWWEASASSESQSEEDYSTHDETIRYGGYSMSDTGKQLWTFTVFLAAAIALALWNQREPKEAFEFAVGFLFNPKKLLLFLAIAFFPYLNPFWW